VRADRRQLVGRGVVLDDDRHGAELGLERLREPLDGVDHHVLELEDVSDLELEDMVVDAIERLPEPFQAELGSVAIVIEDDATPDQLASVGAHGLYGLYQGVPRTRYGAESAATPSKITIFRSPLVRRHRTRDDLAAAVADVVYHEIAHHFGISDERLRELQRGSH